MTPTELAQTRESANQPARRGDDRPARTSRRAATILTVRLSAADAAHVLGDHALAKLRAERPDWFGTLAVAHVETVERQRGHVDVELTLVEPSKRDLPEKNLIDEPVPVQPTKRRRKAVSQ